MVKPPVQERKDPRISVNDLALYMVSSDTARMGIIKRSKYVSTPTVIRYKDVRPVICAYLSDSMRSVNPLIVAEDMFEQRSDDPSVKPLMQDDAKKSIEVLHSVQKIANQVAGFSFAAAPAKQNTLNINGVEISVRADLIVSGLVKKVPHVGAAILRFTQDDTESEAAIKKREDMGRYAATIMHRHVMENFDASKPISNKLCMSIDVQYQQVFTTPDSNSQRMNNIENACRGIAALWNGI